MNFTVFRELSAGFINEKKKNAQRQGSRKVPRRTRASKMQSNVHHFAYSEAYCGGKRPVNF